MTVSEIKSNILAWIKTGIPNNVKSSNVRALLTWLAIRLNIIETGRLTVYKAPGNSSNDQEPGDIVSGIIENTFVRNGIYLGGNVSLLASYALINDPNYSTSNPTENTYPDIPTMLGDQANQTAGFDQEVTDSSADPNAEDGAAIYRYIGTTDADLEDYIRLTDAAKATLVGDTPFDADDLSIFSEYAGPPVSIDQKFIDEADAAFLKARGSEVLKLTHDINPDDATQIDFVEAIGQINQTLGYKPFDIENVTIQGTDMSQPSTYFYVDFDTLTIQQQFTEPTFEEYRTKAPLVRYASNGTVFTNFENIFNPAGQYANLSRDIVYFLKKRKIPLYDGLTISGNNDGTLNRSAGVSLEISNGTGNAINTPTFALRSSSNFVRLQSTGTFTFESNISAVNTQYENNGVLTTIPNGRFIVIPVLHFSSGNFSLQYAQAIHQNIDDAIASVNDAFTYNPINDNGDLLGWIIVQEGITDLTNDALFQFKPYSIGSAGAGVVAGALLAVNNLQELTDIVAARTKLEVYSKAEVNALSGGAVAPTIETGNTITFDAPAFYNITDPNIGQPINIDPTWAKDGTVVMMTVHALTEPTITGATTRRKSAFFLANKPQEYWFIWQDGRYNLNIQKELRTSLETSTLTASQNTTTANDIDWTAVVDADNYALYASTTDDLSTATKIYDGALLTFSHTGLTSGNTWYYWLVAKADDKPRSQYAFDNVTVL